MKTKLRVMVKRAMSLLLTVVLLFGSAPLSGFVGLELPSLPELAEMNLDFETPEFVGLKKIADSVSGFFENFKGFSFNVEAAATSGSCGDNLTWSFDETTGVITISGKGNMKDCSYYSNAPWYSYCNSIKTVLISDGVTSIGYKAFKDCSSLTSVTIGKSVLSIGDNAFINCSSLTNITIPDNMTSIGSSAFNGCTSLASIVIGNGVTSISNGAFANCTSLTEVSFASNSQLTIISDGMFKGCTSLAKITIPENVTSIGYEAFRNCTVLSSVFVPNNVTSIGNYAFCGCTMLASIVIPDGVSGLGNQVFGNCTGLTELTMPASLKIVDSEYTTFTNCTNIEKITLTKGTGKMQDYDTNSLSSSTDTYYSYTPWYISRNNCKEIIIELGVTNIGDSAFYNCTGLMSITIPESVLTIRDSAFYGCSSLSSVIIPDSVTNIGYRAFCNCTSLAELTIGYSVINIGDSAFNNCTALENATIPDSVTTIGNYAFGNCTALESATIPDSVTSIGNNTFTECRALKNAVIGNGIKCISNGTFYCCSNLETVTIGDSVADISASAFYLCSSLKSITIPESVINIDGSAFEGCSSLANVTFGKNSRLTNINERAFVECDSLTNIKLPDGLVSVGKEAFRNCESLTSITIPGSVIKLGGSAFYRCYALENVIIGSGVTSIGDGMFADCKSLASITIPDSVTVIGSSAFMRCESLKSVTIPNSVTNIGASAFSDCKVLEGITIPNSVTSIGGSAFMNCDSVKSITIPNSVTSLSDRVFGGCDSLSSITIPYSMTAIGDEAFSYCTSLISISIPYGVESIGSKAFYNCSSLINIDIPDSVKYIGGNAFYNTGYYIDSDNWENSSRHDGVLYIDNHLVAVEHKYGFISSYTVKSGTKTIAPGAFASCYSLENITIPNSITSISSSMFDNCKSLTSVTIPDSVTNIGNSAFRDCESLVSVIIPDSVKSIGSYAFSGCSLLGNIQIPNSVTKIGNWAFSYCGSLMSVTIPDSVTIIDYCAFYGCNSLTRVTIGNSVKSIGVNAFYSCDSLEFLTIGDGVTSIADSAFSDCTALATITIPNSVINIGKNVFYKTAYYNNLDNWIDGVLYIGNHLIKADKDKISDSYSIKIGTVTIASYAFYGCRATSITIPDSVTIIGDSSFYGCLVANITIPDSVRTIGVNAFYDCTSLKNITIPESVTSIGEQAFGCYDSMINYDLSIDIYYEGDIVDWCSISFGDSSSNPMFRAKNLYINGKLIPDKLVIPDGVTGISNYAFYCCKSITSVTISDTVTSIGDYAFNNCTALENATIPDSVTTIGNYAFGNCTALESATIPDSVTTIGNYAFNSCTALENATIPDSVTTIGASAFAWSGLEFITISDSINSIGYSAFAGVNLSDIYYEGIFEYPWKNTIIDSGNEPLFTAAIHFGNSQISIEKESYIVKPENEIVINGEFTAEVDEISKIKLTYEVNDKTGVKVISDSLNIVSETEGTFSAKIKGLKEGKYTLTVKNGNASAKCDIIVGEISELVIQFEDIRDNLYSLNGFFFDSIGNYYNNALEVIVKLTNQVKLEYLLTEFTEKEKKDAAFKVKFVAEVNSGFSFDGAGKRQIEFVYDPLEFRKGEEIKLYIHQENENAKNLTVTYKAYIDDVLKHTGTEKSTIMSYQEKYTLEHISALTDKKGYYPILNDSFAQKMIAQEDSKYYKWNKFLSDGLVGTAANYLTGDLDEENAYKLVIADLINGMYDQETLEEASLTIYSEAFTNVVTQAAGAIVESALEDSYIRERLGKLGVKDIIKVFTGGASSDATAVCKAVLNTEKGKKKMLTALSGVSLVDNGLFILEEAGLILDSYNNYIRAVNAMSAMNTFAQMDKALIDVFFAMYGCSYNNPTLKKALNDYLSHMNDTRANRILKIVKCYVDSNITSLSKTVFKSIQMIYSYGLRDVIAKSVSTFFKYAGEVISGIDLGVYVFDFLWSSSDYDAAMSRVVAAGHMSVVLEKAIGRLGDNIKATKSFSNAVVLDRALNLFGEVEKYAYKHFIDALNAEGNCLFLTDPLSVKMFGDKTDDYKKEIADLLTESAKLESLYCHSLRLERIASKVTGLTPSDTSERIFEPKFKIVCVRCPVDAYIYDGTTLIASFVGNKIKFLADGIKALLYHNEKYICLPSTVDYDIKIEATKNGEMSYSVFEYDGEGSLTREVSYDDIELEKGQIFTGSVNDELLTPAENYDLNTNGETIDGRKDSSDGYDFTKDIDIKIVGNVDVGLNVPTEFKLLCSNLPVDSKIIWTCNDESIKLTPANDSLSCEIVAEKEGTATLTASVSGSNIISEIEISVSEKTYTINWYIGDSVETHTYRYGQKVEVPEIVVPEGYNFIRWSSEIPETMPADDLYIMAVFEKIKYTCADCGDEFDDKNVYNEHLYYEEFRNNVQLIILTPSTTKVNYGDTLVLHADLGETQIPEGYKIEWIVEGTGMSVEPGEDGLTCKVTSIQNGKVTVVVRIVGEDGEILLNANGEELSASQEITSNVTFWQKIVSFFKNLFRISRIILQAE